MSGATRIESFCVYPRCGMRSKLGSMFTMIEHMAQHFKDQTRLFDHGIGRCRQCHAVFTDLVFVSVHDCHRNFIEIFENRTSSNDQKTARDASLKFHAFVYQYLIMVPPTKRDVFNRQMEMVDQYKKQIHPNNAPSTPRYNPSTPSSSPAANFAFREASPAPSPNRSRPASRPNSPAARPFSPARPRRPLSPTAQQCFLPTKPYPSPPRPRSPAMTKLSAPVETRRHADRTGNTSTSDQSFSLKRPAEEKDNASKENSDQFSTTGRRRSTVVELRNSSRLGGLISDAPDPCVRPKSPARPSRSNKGISFNIDYLMSGIDRVHPKNVQQESTAASTVSSKKSGVTSRDDAEMDLCSTDVANDQRQSSFVRNRSPAAASNAPTASTEMPRPQPHIPAPNPTGVQYMPPTGVPPPPSFHSGIPYGWQHPHPGMPGRYHPPQPSDASLFYGFTAGNANNYTPASSNFSDSFETSSSRGERSPPSGRRNFARAENFMSTRGDYRGRGRGGFRGSGDRGGGRGGFHRNYSDRQDGNTDSGGRGFGGRRDERESRVKRSRSPRGRGRSYSRSPKSDDDGSNKRNRGSPPRTSTSRRSPPSAWKGIGRSRREESSPNHRGGDRRQNKPSEKSPPRGSLRSEKSRRGRERSYSHSGDSD